MTKLMTALDDPGIPRRFKADFWVIALSFERGQQYCYL
jgi:hypothetical protein